MTRYYSEEQYYEEVESRCATEAEADREWAYNVGQDEPDRAWILSDRDVWYPNPFYTGPRVPHPESDPEEEGSEAPGFDSPKAPEWTGFDSPECDTVEEARDYRSARERWIDDDIPF